ncbi:hypothetical protein Taro_030579 [Colocasia esculenta]|uniref:Uncharacterized protein n=1 Tax=Colocasia esculenta TaxID=4460 RepID=A0A843VWJ0_COLES|nr:hypothetical protein [Colocasia esculenta]
MLVFVSCVPRCCFRFVLTPLVLRESCLARPWLWVVVFTLFRCFVVLCGVRCRTVVVPVCTPCVASSVSCERERLYRSESRVAFLHVLRLSSKVECELQESVTAVAGCACHKRGCWFARAAVKFFVGLRVRVGVSRRLREPACGVAFTGARLLPVDPVEGSCLVGCPLVVGVCPYLMSPLLLGYVLCWLCYVWPCVPVRRWALCSAQSASLLELSRCFVCRVAPLVERCDTCLWLLPTLCWLVVNSGEVLPKFFSVGSGGGEVLPRTVLFSFFVVAALPSGLRCVSRCCFRFVLTPLVLRESCLARPWLWVVVFTLFRCFVVLCGRRFPLYCFVE